MSAANAEADKRDWIKMKVIRSCDGIIGLNIKGDTAEEYYNSYVRRHSDWHNTVRIPMCKIEFGEELMPPGVLHGGLMT